MSPMEKGSSHCASSTRRIQPGREGCAGAACVARPRSSRSSISARVLHRRAAPCVERRMDSSVFLRRCMTPRKRLLWSRRCTPLRWRVNATAPDRRPASTARAMFVRADASDSGSGSGSGSVSASASESRRRPSPSPSRPSCSMSMPSPSSASIAPGLRCLVASSIATALTESRNPPSVSHRRSPFSPPPTPDASLRLRASPSWDARREGPRCAEGPGSRVSSARPTSGASSAPGDAGSSDNPPRRVETTRSPRRLPLARRDVRSSPFVPASEEACLEPSLAQPDAAPLGTDRREDHRSEPSASSSAVSTPSAACSTPRISRMGLAYRPSRSRSSPQPSSRATTAALRSREDASGEKLSSWWNSR